MSWARHDDDSDDGYQMNNKREQSFNNSAYHYSENPYDIDLSFRVSATASGGKFDCC